MVKKLRQWWRARKIRNSTHREMILAGRLEAAEQEARTYKGHYQRLQGDFAALWDDHATLKSMYADLQFARLQDFRLGRHNDARVTR